MFDGLDVIRIFERVLFHGDPNYRMIMGVSFVKGFEFAWKQKLNAFTDDHLAFHVSSLKWDVIAWNWRGVRLGLIPRPTGIALILPLATALPLLLLLLILLLHAQ
ncbi:MAG: hypothetical protein HQL86_06950 [Magnetococcales bacterium]|nr:hypothetical protein [Magnetococcales bacterium]